MRDFCLADDKTDENIPYLKTRIKTSGWALLNCASKPATLNESYSRNIIKNNIFLQIF